MKERKKLIWPVLCMLLAALSVFLYIRLEEAQADTYTVRMYKDEWSEKYGCYLTRSKAPAQEAEWASGMHEAEPVKVSFDGSVLRQSAGYGPTSAWGWFRAEDVNDFYGQEVLTEDWPFCWGSYFTNDWFVCDAYLYVELPQEPDGDATATLTVYLRGWPKPVETLTWTGKLGEVIGFPAVEM